MIASAGRLRLVNELVGLYGLLGDGPDGVLEDLPLSACHVREGWNVSPTFRKLGHATCPITQVRSPPTLVWRGFIPI
jgi:hypothetical protein